MTEPGLETEPKKTASSDVESNNVGSNTTRATTDPEPVSPGDGGRAATAFVVKLVVLALLLGFGEKYLKTLGGIKPFQHVIAAAATWLAGLFDTKLSQSQGLIVSGDKYLMVTIECTALFATGLFCAAAVAFPVRWRERVVGFFIGILGVAILNILRIAGLSIIARRAPNAFHFAHLVLMQWFLISCVAPMWLLWAVWATRRAVKKSGD